MSGLEVPAVFAEVERVAVDLGRKARAELEALLTPEAARRVWAAQEAAAEWLGREILFGHGRPEFPVEALEVE